MNQIQMNLSTLPLALICIEDGRIAIVPKRKFKTIFDVDDKGNVKAIFDMKGFQINGIDYIYQFPYNYKDDEGLLNWLKGETIF